MLPICSDDTGCGFGLKPLTAKGYQNTNSFVHLKFRKKKSFDFPDGKSRLNLEKLYFLFVFIFVSPSCPVIGVSNGLNVRVLCLNSRIKEV